MAKKKVTVANLDKEDIYQGVMKINADALIDQHVQVPAHCDLAIGKYKWDRQQGTFMPLILINRGRVERKI